MNATEIVVKYCSGTSREKHEAVQFMLEWLIPRATAYMYKNNGKNQDEMIQEVAWESLTGRNKLLERLCSQDMGSIEAYYLTIVRNEWSRLQQQKQSIVEVDAITYSTAFSSSAELIELLSKIKRLSTIYQAPLLISAMGFSYLDIAVEYDEIKLRVSDMLRNYEQNPEDFELEGDIFDISNDTFRQRLSKGRRRLKALYHRN
ncbi:MAG: hypothetical protein IAE84_04575 [Saprospiraceae bacterium]|nr:hypothetical protein [Saprospiraceae bacterium]HRJ13529.1 hypothetical protein [Saprospiraceae bacterium]HRK82380.1 hypothetical protein [Saprospiraceae bacterium]